MRSTSRTPNASTLPASNAYARIGFLEPIASEIDCMSPGTHDTLVYRLAQMLVKLNQGEKLDPESLAQEFGVNLRTIQRDLNERFAYLPLQKSNGRYHLDAAFLGKLSTRDIERFASLAGVRGLFPSFSDEFLRDIFDTHLRSSLLIRGHAYEDISGQEAMFRQLERAIVETRKVAFRYRKPDLTKAYDDVEPYRMLNHRGIWYLAARDHGKLKTFGFTRIEALTVAEVVFEPDPSVGKILAEDEGIWISPDRTEIVLEVSREAAGYFRRRTLIANQVIQKELDDGRLILSTRVGHLNQVMPIVRYWIPHVRIISPQALQAELEAELSAYVGARVDSPLPAGA